MSRAQRLAFLFSVLFVGLLLGPALAHLFALPNKLPLDREAYFVVQGIYAGWSLIGIAVFAALASTLWLTLALRRDRAGFGWALAALLSLVAAQAIFWIFTYPANVATANWTEQPADWESLRTQWEYSHAAGALLTVAALLCLTATALARMGQPTST